MSQADIYIVGVGAQTPVGKTAPSSAAAVRAAVSRLGEHPYLTDAEGEPLQVARASWLGGALEGEARMRRLVAPAALEALAPLERANQPLPPLALLLGLPAARPGLPPDLGSRLPRLLAARFPEFARPATAEVFATGHAAGLMALERSLALLAQGSLGLCLVGGVESYQHDETLLTLLEAGQLFTNDNPWGFMPGEGAGFVLLARADTARRLGLAQVAHVLAAASAREPNPWPRGVCVGKGLSQCVGEVLRALPTGEKVGHLWGDLNGQPHRADELGFTLARVAQHIHDPDRVFSPATCWGDQGAATGPLLVNMVIQSAARAWAPGPHHMVWASSEAGERGAALLSTPTTGRR